MEHCSVNDVAAITLATVAVVALKLHSTQK